VYAVSRSAGFMWHVIHTEIREDWCIRITVLRQKFEGRDGGITDRMDY
jgi:hypothetical protein